MNATLEKRPLPDVLCKHIVATPPEDNLNQALREAKTRVSALKSRVRQCLGVEAQLKRILSKELERARRRLFFLDCFTRGITYPLLDHEAVFALRNGDGYPSFGLFSLDSNQLYIKVWRAYSHHPWSHCDSLPDWFNVYFRSMGDVFAKLEADAEKKSWNDSYIHAQFQGAIPDETRRKLKGLMRRPIPFVSRKQFDDVFLLCDVDWKLHGTKVDPLVLGYTKKVNAFYVVDSFDVVPTERIVQLEFTETP